MGSFLAICRMHLLLVVVLCVRLMMMERCKVTTKLAVTFTHYLLLLSCSSFVSSVVVLVVLCLDFVVASQKHFIWIYFIDMLMRHPHPIAVEIISVSSTAAPLCIFTGFIGLPGHLIQIMADCKKRYTFSLSEGRPWLAISPRFLCPEI